jgi:hypothetical protein
MCTFYHALAHGKLISPGSLGQMLHYLPLTMGHDPPAGTPYGLGILKEGLNFEVVDPQCGSDNSTVPYQGKCYPNLHLFPNGTAPCPHLMNYVSPCRITLTLTGTLIIILTPTLTLTLTLTLTKVNATVRSKGGDTPDWIGPVGCHVSGTSHLST